MNVKDKILKQFDDYINSLNIPNMKAVMADEITPILREFTDLTIIKRMLWPKSQNKN